MKNTTLKSNSPEFKRILPEIHEAILSQDLSLAINLYCQATGVSESKARSEIELEKEFLDIVFKSIMIDIENSSSAVTSRTAFILGAAVGFNGDEPSGWDHPADRETLFDWAKSHYTGSKANLAVVFDALILQELFFEVHPQVFATPHYYCTFDTDFLKEIPPEIMPRGMWNQSCEDGGNGNDLGHSLWDDWRTEFNEEYGSEWLKAGVCAGQGSQSGESPWGPCKGDKCGWYKSGDELCNHLLEFKSPKGEF